jgi:hypothetical protein
MPIIVISSASLGPLILIVYTSAATLQSEHGANHLYPYYSPSCCDLNYSTTFDVQHLAQLIQHKADVDHATHNAVDSSSIGKPHRTSRADHKVSYGLGSNRTSSDASHQIRTNCLHYRQ